LSPGQLVAVAAIAGLAAFVQSAAGFGFALMAVPLMALAVNTRQAVVVATMLSLCTSSLQAWTGRHDIDRVVARRLILACFVGMPFGLAVFLAVDEGALRVMLGVSILAMVALLARGLDLTGRGSGVDWVAGFVSGVLSTSLSTNGPPLVFVLQGRQFEPTAFRATLRTIFAATGVVSLTAFLVTGQVTRESLIAFAYAVPATAVGLVAGERLQPHLDGDRFRPMVLGLLVLSALSALAAGLL
jgi:uncharacterized protein